MSAPAPVAGQDARHRRGVAFWAGAVVGWAFIGWGLRGVFHHHLDTRPGQLARFFVGGALVHDLILAPTVLALGVVISRVAPARARAWVQAVLLICGCLALFTYPEVRDYARILHNPTSLPYNYTANLFVACGIVAVMTLVVVMVTHRGRTRRSSGRQ